MTERDKLDIRIFDQFIQSTPVSGRFYISAIGNRVSITDDEKKLYDDRDWTDHLKGFLEVHGYAVAINKDEKECQISERGNLAKELGGHLQFQKYRKAEINLLAYQRKVNKWLIAATVIAGLAPVLVFAVDKIFFRYDNKVQFQPSIEVLVDSSFYRNDTPRIYILPSK